MLSDETRELIADTSKRGQPIEPEILDEAKSIDIDTKNNSGQQKETEVKQPVT